MSKCNACKGKGCDYCDEFDLSPREPTRMVRVGWNVVDSNEDIGGAILSGDGAFDVAREYVRKFGGTVRAVYAKVSDVKGSK